MYFIKKEKFVYYIKKLWFLVLFIKYIIYTINILKYKNENRIYVRNKYIYIYKDILSFTYKNNFQI